MAITRDASSPAAAQITGNGAGTDSGTSASFTPPVGAQVYASGCFNTVAAATPSFSVSSTGGGLSSWALVAVQTNASGGSVVVYRATVMSSVATTVTLTCTSSGNTNTNWNGELFVDVWTGANGAQIGAATATGTSTTQNISPTVTTTANNSQVVGVAVEWAKRGAPTSTDTSTSYDSASPGTSGIRAYKASLVATPASTSINFNAAAAFPVWSYVLYELFATNGNIAVAEEVESRDITSGNGLTATVTVTAGESLDIYTTWDTSGSATLSSVSISPAVTVTLRDSQTDSVDVQAQAHLTADGLAAGTYTLTQNLSTAATHRAFLIKRIINTAGYDTAATTAHAGQLQTGVATTADAVTSGNTSTLSSWPALISALSQETSSSTTPIAGTGFTSAWSGWPNGVDTARSEHKRLTATTVTAATFTASNPGRPFITQAAVFRELSAGDAVSPAFIKALRRGIGASRGGR